MTEYIVVTQGSGSGFSLKFFYGGVRLGSANLDPISDQNMLFSGILFQTRAELLEAWLALTIG